MEATGAEQEFSSIIYHDTPLSTWGGDGFSRKEKKLRAWREERLEKDGFVVLGLPML